MCSGGINEGTESTVSTMRGDGTVISSIPYDVSYRNIKYPRLEFKRGTLLLVLPFGHDPEVFVENHRAWILKTIKFIEECLRRSSSKRMVERTDEQLSVFANSLVESVSAELGVKVNRIRLRWMTTKWASCSSRRNLTINRLLRHVPDYLVEYVIFHELAHLLEKKHSERFWAVVSNRFGNWQQLERDLFTYWFSLVERLPNGVPLFSANRKMKMEVGCS